MNPIRIISALFLLKQFNICHSVNAYPASNCSSSSTNGHNWCDDQQNTVVVMVVTVGLYRSVQEMHVAVRQEKKEGIHGLRKSMCECTWKSQGSASPGICRVC